MRVSSSGISISTIKLYILLNSLIYFQLIKGSWASGCAETLYGCCPDGVTSADGPNFENCFNDNDTDEETACENSEYGCCSDDVTPAKGPFKEGCIDFSCRASEFGCCPDQVTPSKRADLTDCPIDCSRSLYGCCVDGKTASRGIDFAGCPGAGKNDRENGANCQTSKFGCCDDGVTPAQGPDKDNCPDYVIDLNEPVNENDFFENSVKSLKLETKVDPDDTDNAPTDKVDCSKSKYECCPDGVTPANGSAFKDCAEDVSRVNTKYLLIGKNNICLLPEPNKNCYNYSLKWRFDANEGRCIQFWYGGCDPNENLFNTTEECESRCVNPKGTEMCKLPLINPTRICQQNITRYYYDLESSSCKQFTYSGCLGNANNFQTLEECEKKCQIELLFEQCSFIPDKGPCRGDYERWYFDSKIGLCRTFKYGGCMKNKNNHFSENDCIDTCVKPKQKNVCLLPKIAGNCDQQINSWYYDFKEGKCKELVYSGCNGNLNRFETQEACEYTCQGLNEPIKQQEIVDEVCNSPKKTGVCHLNLQRWYFNKTTMMCHQFTYSGCDGNSNNFENEVDCRTTCGAKEIDPCALPMDHGTCDKYKIYWYFNTVDKECVRFYYGGCDGNQNRFDNKENCELSCKLTKEEKAVLLKLPKQCLHPMEYGNNCGEIQPKWYFDTQNKLCYPFEYSGCGAEFTNRFDSNEDCNRTCVYPLADNSTVDHTNVNMNMSSSTKQVKTSTEKEPTFDLCSLPMVKGNCSQKVNKWFYDNKSKYCRQFEFTGCNGNENRFETRHQCTEICEVPRRREICNSYKVQGPCSNFQNRWFYDIESKTCKDFVYGGCLGNENNFESQIECRNFCWEYLSEESKLFVNLTTQANTKPMIETTTAVYDQCSLRKDEGENCGNRTDRWYYDSSDNECKRFMYKGCGGNDNNFETREKCTIKCNHNYLDTSFINYESPCESPSDISIECLNEYTLEILQSKQDGNLNQLIWYYDIETRSCKAIAKDCINEDNPNRFASKHDCKFQCLPNVTDIAVQDDCLLPMQVGDKCNQQVWRWYYDSTAGQCNQFSYSGCHGNNNNFPTSKSCLSLCATIGGHACPSLSECTLDCKYGRVVSVSKCELCECNDPCENVKCDANQECVVENLIPTCRSKNKPGDCPDKMMISNKTCNISECSSDAECSLDQKCCLNSCSSKICVPASFDTDPIIEEFKHYIELNHGEKLILPCKVSGNPLPTVTWFKNHREISFDPYDVSSRVQLGQNNSLIINNISERDEAIYSCRASSRNGKAVVKESNVVIYAPLIANHESYEKYELLGNDVILYCNVSGKPTPHIEWYYEKNKVRSDMSKYLVYSNMLLIKRFEYSDIGNYSCIANSAPNSRHGNRSITIHVQLKRAVPGEIKFSFTQVYGDLNMSIVLHCNHTGVPKPNITWLAPPYREIIHNSDKYHIINGTELKINSLQYNDSGIYRCSASNEFSYNYMKKKYGSILLNVFSPPIILNKPKKVYAYEASYAVLNCQANGMPKPEINWYKEDKLIVKSQALVSGVPHSKYIFSAKNGSLTVLNLKHDDSATYYCYASSIDRFPIASLNYTIKVINEKLFVNQTHNVRANEMDTLKLDCKIPNYERIIQSSWNLNETIRIVVGENGKYHLDNENRSLSIQRVEYNDSGVYECFAETQSYNYVTKLNVTVGPRPMTVTSKHKHFKTEKGKSVVLDCTWWFNDSENLLFNVDYKNNTQWLRNDTILDDKLVTADVKYEFLDSSNTLLKVTDLTISETNDIYTCNFKLKNNTIQQSKFTLEIGVKPTVREDSTAGESNQTNKWFEKYETVYLECPIDGTPVPNKTWYFNSNVLGNEPNLRNNILIDTDSSLKINEFDEQHQGVYTCNATNDFGHESYNYKLELAQPMYIIEPIQKVIQAKKFENVLLKCEYRGGKPEPITSWLFNGNLLNTFNRKYTTELNILTIKNVIKPDGGLYTCILSNGYHAQQSLNFTLIVADSVTISFQPEHPTFNVGTEGVIKCNAESASKVNEMTWFKNGLKLEVNDKFKMYPNGTLAIRNVQVTDTGRYSCRVSSNESHTTKSVLVKVVETTSSASDCEDKSSYADCKLVVARGYCNKWGKFCCKTCRQSGFDVK